MLHLFVDLVRSIVHDHQTYLSLLFFNVYFCLCLLFRSAFYKFSALLRSDSRPSFFFNYIRSNSLCYFAPFYFLFFVRSVGQSVGLSGHFHSVIFFRGPWCNS